MADQPAAAPIASQPTAAAKCSSALGQLSPEDALRLATQTGKLGLWDWDIRSNRVSWTDSLYEIHGVQRETFPATVEAFAQLVHPDDRDFVAASIQRTLEEGAPYELEFRAVRPDGRTVWLFTNARIVHENGQPVRLTGATMDITDRKRVEIELAATRDDLTLQVKALRDSEQRFRTLTSHAPVGIFLTDPSGDCLFVNETWCSMAGMTHEQAAGKGWAAALHPDDRQRVFATWYDAAQRGIPFDCEYRFQRKAHGSVHGCVNDDMIVTWLQGSAIELHTAEGNLAGHIGTVVDITARKAAEAAMREAKDAAEAANRSKDKFLAVLSHELRTPLTPVLMTVAARQNDPDLPPDMREDLAMIRRNVELETKLIDDLLDLSRITSGKLRLAPQQLDLNDAIRHVCGICRAQILEKGIRLHCDLDPGAGVVTADPARLQQVLWNVIKNAAKFTPEGGEIFVASHRPSASRVAVSVRDTGAGIAPQLLPRIFDAFEQGESRITRQFGGLGLGLAISKALIELHAGTIRAESNGPGTGATFTIELPTPLASSRQQQPQSDNTRATKCEKLRLLIVEDHPDTAAILCKLLGAAGYAVKAADSAATALNLASSETFDLLISDIGLPDATGYELMQQLRQRYAMKGIAMSGYGMDDDIKKSHDAGFADHLVKPINLAQLHDAIRRLVIHEVST